MAKSTIILKVDLETLIFFLAAKHSEQILSCNGFLIGPHAKGALAVLLELYNQYYGKENKSFLKDEIVYVKKVEIQEQDLYFQIKSKNPPAQSFYLHIY